MSKISLDPLFFIIYLFFFFVFLFCLLLFCCCCCFGFDLDSICNKVKNYNSHLGNTLGIWICGWRASPWQFWDFSNSLMKGFTKDTQTEMIIIFSCGFVMFQPPSPLQIFFYFFYNSVMIVCNCNYCVHFFYYCYV